MEGRIAHIREWLSTVKALQLFQIMRQGATILTAILLAHSALPTHEVGYYEMLLYVGYLLSFAWVSGLMQALLACFPNQKKPQQRQLIFSAWGVFTSLSLFFAGSLWLFPETIMGLLTQERSVPYTALFAGFLMVNWPAHLQEHFYLLANRPWALLFYGVVSSTAQLVAIILPIWLGYSFYWSFVSLLGVGMAKFIWLTAYTWRNGQWQWHPPLVRHWLHPAWPLILYALLGALNQSFDPWFVGFFYQGDETTFAVYRYGARELPLVMALAGAFSSAVIPIVASNTQAGLAAVKTKSRQLFHLIFPLTIVLLLTSKWWFVAVFSDRFADSVPIFNVLLLVTASHLLFTRTILVALQDTRWLLLFVIGGIIINVVLSFVFAPIWGLVGIAGATVLAYVTEKGLMFVYLHQRHQISLATYTDLRWWGAYSLVLLLAFGLTTIIG